MGWEEALELARLKAERSGNVSAVGSKLALQTITGFLGAHAAASVAHEYTLGPEDRRTISDFDRLLRDEAERQNAQAHGDIVTVLSAEDPVCEIGETRFIGLTLWTDWVQASRWVPNRIPQAVELCAGEARAVAGHWRSGAREYRAIRTEKGRWSPYDAVAEHAREKTILLDELVSFHHGPTVVVTHHPPLADCADAYRDRGLPCFPLCQRRFGLTSGSLVTCMRHSTSDLGKLVQSAIPSKAGISTLTS